MTSGVHVYPQYPVQSWSAVFREMGFPPIGKPGRGQRASDTCWGHLVLLMVRTGALSRPIEDFDYISDMYCAAYKQTLHVSRVPDAMRKAFQWLRKALLFGISVIGANGRVRSRSEVEAEYTGLNIPKPARKLPRRDSEYFR